MGQTLKRALGLNLQHVLQAMDFLLHQVIRLHLMVEAFYYKYKPKFDSFLDHNTISNTKDFKNSKNNKSMQSLD